MANGKKDYFRHSFFAGNDDKIVTLITDHGKQAYFHYFRLLELCGQQASEEVPEKFVFHRRTLCAELLVTNSKLCHHLLAMQSSLLLEYNLNVSKVEVLIPNFSKYLGRYTNKKASKTVKKRKEKERKEKKIKVNTTTTKTTSKSSKPKPLLYSENLIKLFDDEEIIKWLKDTGIKKIQFGLYEKYDHEVLVEEITNAFYWQHENNKKRKAGAFIKTWMERCNNASKINQEKINEKLFEVAGHCEDDNLPWPELRGEN